MPADIVEWAAFERLQLIAGGVSIVRTDHETLAGLVELHAADILPMFRRDGSGPDAVRVHRIRAAGKEVWSFISDPGEGLKVAKADILITAATVSRFEEENELVRRPSAAAAVAYKYDWDAMYVAVIKRIHDHGLPDTQAEFVGEFQDWFIRRSDNGDAPDERTIRRRLNPIWRELRETA